MARIKCKSPLTPHKTTSTHSGVCHSDLGIMSNAWKGLPHPTQAGQVGGHEGVGVIVKMGTATREGAGGGVKVGDRVGIKWIAGTCGGCLPCLEGMDAQCVKGKISGYYTGIRYCLPFKRIQLLFFFADETVLKGHIAVQLATRGMAMRVIGIDAGSKEKLVRDCGAEHFIDVTKHDDKSIAEEVVKTADGLGASAVLVCTASNKAYAQSIDMLRFGGTMVCVGIPEGQPEPIGNAFPAKMVFKNITIASTAVGNRRDAIEVMDFAARGVVKTVYRTEKVEKLNDVFQEMHEGKLSGRVVIDLD
ncbi:MAG: hypothetical protein Q9182_000657 [Xanthomendoza sp. 2 TL-2023]